MLFVKAFGSKGDENGQFYYLSGIAVDADDDIVVADNNHRIQIFNKDGNWKQTIRKYGSGNGEFNLPWGVAVCKADGRIFFSDEKNHCIQVFSSDGKFLFKFGLNGVENGLFQNPDGLALSNCDRCLFICDSRNGSIQLFNLMNGGFVKNYGSNGLGDGQFNGSIGIIISPSGQIIVSEFSSDRVQIFE